MKRTLALCRITGHTNRGYAVQKRSPFRPFIKHFFIYAYKSCNIGSTHNRLNDPDNKRCMRVAIIEFMRFCYSIQKLVNT